MTLLSIVCSALLPLPIGLTAVVNDPLSHGTLGDNLLSLDEAIQLANGTLALSLLSAAEQAQVTGAGTMVETIRVDPMMVPTITVQMPLTDLMGMGMMGGPRLTVSGMAMGGGMGRVTLQGGTAAHVFAMRSHFVTVMGFRFAGGQVGVDAAMMPMAQPVMDMAMVMDCAFDAQTQCGIRLHATGMEQSMLMTMRSQFTNMPAAFCVLDNSTGGAVMGESEFLTMDGCGIGCDLIENGSGNLSMWMLFRSTFQNGQTLARKRRGAGSAQQFMFRFVHTTATCTGDVVDVEGAPGGLTMVHHHHSDWVAGPGQKAFYVHPRTAMFDVHGSEMGFWGDVQVEGNPFTMRCWQQNNEYHGGTVRYDVDGALPNLLWNRYTNCTLVVPPTAMSPVVVRQSEFLNTQIDGQSLFAPITLQGCYRSGGAIAGQASEVAAAPAPFLGSTSVDPVEPQIGTAVHLAADLPFGIGLFWVFSWSYARPTTTIEPVRFYGDPLSAIALPGLVVFQSTTNVPLPQNAALVGTELYVQGVAVPLLGQSHVPAYHLPRGGLIRPRL